MDLSLDFVMVMNNRGNVVISALGGGVGVFTVNGNYFPIIA